MTGSFEQEFNLTLDGIELKSPVEFLLPSLGLKARISPGVPVIALIQVEDETEVDAQRLANRFIQETYQSLLLKFGASIQRTEPPKSVWQKFQPKAPDGLPTMYVSQTHQMDVFVSIPPVPLPASALEVWARAVEERMAAAEPATSPQLETAVAMYASGLEAKDRTVRFLVLYSALTLAASSKSRRGNQRKVDDLLLAASPGLAVFPNPDDATRMETLYTKLRNELIHAEDRRRDPARAISELQANVQSFQRDVSLVLSSLI